ncbi:MAG: 50S ribosomal protein L11 methyltransferase [Desulfobulbaceae bacterium]|nr:50S ribosomal protein L11 methyltransferase [Desulfobulbaceae bacterium]
MLRPPYSSYKRLYVYHLDLARIPQVNSPDLIGIWMEDRTAVLFFHTPQKELIENLCTRENSKLIYEADLDYQDWEAGQLISTFTENGLTVAPVWEDVPADIVLDPSVIFGSGFHPTTRACLQILLKYLKTPEIKIDSAIDLGTGTGLLSIAAAHFGVQSITAVDNNPLACQVAAKNCKLNKVDANVTVKEIDLRSDLPSTTGCNLVVANLYQGLLKQLIQTPDFWLADLYILSGFISSMEADLLAELPTEKIRFLERTRVDNWCIWVIANRNLAQ